MKGTIISFLLLFSCNNCVFAQHEFSITNKTNKQLDSLTLLYVPPNAPGVATAIIHNGKLLYEQVGGFANLQDSLLINANTQFNIASNAKQFTALAILKLEQEKKLDLSDDIRQYFPGLYVSIKEKISIAHLLNHSSGIRDVYDLIGLTGNTWWKQSDDNRDVFNYLLQQQDLNFTSGSQHLYSNSNYILLALLIEKLSKTSFKAYTDDMFKQLGMTQTTFFTNKKDLTNNAAIAYFNFGIFTSYDWMWKATGDGNLYSTLQDLCSYEKLIYTIDSTAPLINLIKKCQQLIQSAPIKTYGYGLEHGEYKGFKTVYHEGATGAFKSMIIRFPEKQLSFITLTNSGKITPNPQTWQMTDIVLGLPSNQSFFKTVPSNVGKKVMEQDLTGLYQTTDGFTFEFLTINKEFVLRREGRNDVVLEREADNIFRQKYDPKFKQEFLVNKNGEMTVTAYYTEHAPYTLTRYQYSWKNFPYNQLPGYYLNKELNLGIEINYNPDNTYTARIGVTSIQPIQFLSPFKITSRGYHLAWVGNSRHPFQTILLNGGRIKNVRFVRVN